MTLTKQKIIYPNEKYFWKIALEEGDEIICITGIKLEDNVQLHLLATEKEPYHVKGDSNR